MKKIFTVFLILFTAYGVFAQSNGVIRELAGTVEIKRPGTSAFTAAKNGDVISQDTIISTGFKSTALVEIGSAVINVRPLTRLSLTEISASTGTETLNVNLQAGRVRVDVNPPAGTRASMTVSSPVATASVRGTSFEFDTRNLTVRHGAVYFAGYHGAPATVTGGKESKVENDGKPADPAKSRRNKLKPPAPVGTDPASGSAGSAAASSSGTITINIRYYDHYTDY